MNETIKEKVDNLRSIDNVKYYYHVTNSDCDKILEEGLYMVENSIASTALPIEDDFWCDPIKYTLDNQGMVYNKNANIVIIGIDMDIYNNNDYIYETNNIPDGWKLDVPPEYFIPSKFIAGYVDLENEDIVLNDNYDLINEIKYR